MALQAYSPPIAWLLCLTFKMSGRGGRKVGLKLNVTTAETSRRRRQQMVAESPRRQPSSPSSSEPSSCVSSEPESPGAAAMVLAACPRCLMYVMLSEEDELKCPKCNRDVLLNFLAGSSAAAKEAN